MISLGTFTIEFPQHLSSTDVQSAIDMLLADGARVEPQGARHFLVLCEQESQVNRIGVCLFHTRLRSIARVVEVSGHARAEASAYHFPRSREERKTYRK
jgi:hypothetical protein